MSQLDQSLPVNWVDVQLGQAIDYGATEKAEPDAITPETWVLELEDIEKGTSKLLFRETFSARKSKSTKNRFLTGDVLYGKLRPYLNKIIVADKPGVCTTEILPLKPNCAVDGRYLFYWLKHPIFLNYVQSVSYGVNMPRLGTADGKAAPFVLAPFAEQKRIVKKLDTVLARVDACRERLDRVPIILKRFRQSVLAAATTGELSADWRKNEGTMLSEQGKILCEKLATERSARKAKSKGKPAVMAHNVNLTDYMELPATWHRATLDEVTWSVKDGPHFSPKYAETGVPFISGRNVKPGRIDLSTAKRISIDVHEELSIRCKPEYLDILYTKGGTTGIACVNTLKDEFNVWVHVAVLKVLSSNLVNPFYIAHALNGPQCYAQSQRYTHGVGNQDIGLTRMIKIIVPVPPVAEQDEIVARIDTLFAFANRLEARLGGARAATDRLTPALLAKAFRGELVPQDPNDEPALELLSRLAASRSANVSKSRRGRKLD